jgi:hypothetical protein
MGALAKMHTSEVTLDTPVDFTTGRLSSGGRFVSVHAMNGEADGPWIGTLVEVPGHLWPQWARDAYYEQRLGPMKLWAFHPVLKSNEYRVSIKPAGMAFGKMGAALALRDYIANRNQG